MSKSTTKTKISFLDRLRGKKPPETPEKAVELRFYNPLEAKIGQVLDIDIDDDRGSYRGKDYVIKEILECRHAIGGKSFFHTNYIAKWMDPTGSEEDKISLRLIPIDDPVKGSGITHRVVLLKLDAEFEYDEKFETHIKGGVLQVNLEDEDDTILYYHRRNDIRDIMNVDIAIIKDENNDGMVEESEVERQSIRLWDFERKDGDDIEYMFVEMDKQTGWFALWLGKEISQTSIHLW